MGDPAFLIGDTVVRTEKEEFNTRIYMASGRFLRIFDRSSRYHYVEAFSCSGIIIREGDIPDANPIS